MKSDRSPFARCTRGLRSHRVCAAVSAAVLACMSLPAFAIGDIADDSTFDSNVTTDILEPDAYFGAELEYLQDIGRIFNSQYVTGDLSAQDIPDIFAFVAKYPDWPYSMALLATAAIDPSMRDSVMDFARGLAEKYPEKERLQLTMAEILIRYGKYQEAFLFLERAYRIAMKDPENALEEDRVYNSAAVSKFLLLLADMADRAPNDTELKDRLHQVRKDLVGVTAFRTDPKVMEVLLLSCSQELKNTADIPSLPSFILPPVNARVTLERELDSLVQITLKDILQRPEKTSVENPAFPNTFRLLHELGRDSAIMQAALLRLADEPNDTEAMLVISLLSAEREDFPVSASSWDMIFARIQHPSDALVGAYAKALRDAQRYDESSRFFRIYGDRTGNTEPMTIEVAINLFEQGKAKDVLAILRDGPDCFERSILMADCYDLAGDKDNAFRSMFNAQQQDPERGSSTSFRLQLAFRAEEVGEIEIAEAQLLPLIQAKSKTPEVYNSLGYLYAVRNYKLDDAEKYLRIALEMDPDSFAIMDSYAWLLYKKKDYSNARLYIDKAIAAMDESSDTDAIILSHAGDIYFALGDKNKAKSFWERAAKLPSSELDYEGIEWKLGGGTPAQWENYINLKHPLRLHKNQNSR